MNYDSQMIDRERNVIYEHQTSCLILTVAMKVSNDNDSGCMQNGKCCI